MAIRWIAHHLGCREMSKDELNEGPIPVVGARGNYLQHLYSCGKVILTVTFQTTVARRPLSHWHWPACACLRVKSQMQAAW